MKPFKNLIFDIGNVLVDIDYEVTVREFQKLATMDFGSIVSYSKQHHLFDWFETGKISADDFRRELRQFLRPEVSDDEINQAWNSILLNYPSDKFDLLKTLKLGYRTYALSNINEIHVAEINAAARKKFQQPDFASFFHRAYYSNEVGFRKPEMEIYEAILSREKLNPNETFFVDDKEENVVAAKNLGIQAYLLSDRNQLFELLKQTGIIN
ncbi:MAG: HAD family phosphatase [Bacteroidetes bacterium]|nr:HAD family phosphatase [Bacteroidota bacterium]